MPPKESIFDMATSNQKILFNKSNKLNTRADFLCQGSFVKNVGQVNRA